MPFDCEPDRWWDHHDAPREQTFWELVREILWVIVACFPGLVLVVGSVIVPTGLIVVFFAPQTGALMCVTGIGCWIFFVIVFILHHEFGIVLFPE